MKKNKIIIDTDPGVDDALAIAFAVKAKLTIKAICTVYGNSTIKNSTINAQSILEMINTDIPIYQGAGMPMRGQGKLAQSHGDNGLGGFYLKSNKKISKKSSLEYYRSILSESNAESITIVAIGPTTNIGQLIYKYPELIDKIDKIVIMGGVFGENGNISQYAEFNVYNDPYSLELILKSKIKEIIIIPANICRRVIFTKELFNSIDNPKLSSNLSKISEMYINYYSDNSEYGGFKGGVMYDLLTIALLINPNSFSVKKEKVIVETKNKNKFGMTEIVKGTSNCKVITDVKADELKELYIKVMNK